jgi:hypothetical protein
MHQATALVVSVRYQQEIDMTKDQISAAIRFATGNREALAKSKKAGCYYCLTIYAASEVVRFLPPEDTALCPYCGIDSVLADQSPYELKVEILEELHIFWFGTQ